MRKLQIWLIPITKIVGLVLVGYLVTRLIISDALTKYYEGYCISAVGNIVLLLLLIAWLVVDIIFPIIETTRSIK